MSKSKRSCKRSRGTIDRSATATTDVVSQLECSFRNPHAAAIGALIGGLVPWFGQTLAHAEIPSTWASGSHGLALAMIAIVLGCACFSGLSVYKFGRAAFGDARKALGFVLALEGVMIVSHGATSTVALAVLILINAIANGSVIALARDATKRQREADARRAATRTRNRGTRTAPSPVVVVEAPVRQPSPRSQRSTPMVWAAPIWSAPGDVIDAEIVSETRLLA